MCSRPRIGRCGTGVGSGNLSLASTTPPLVAGGGNVASATVSQDIRTALTTLPDSDLSVVRKKGGLNASINLSESWKAYASYTHEKREGARPFGAVWGGGGGGGNVEIPESIDYTTHELAAGVRYADARQSFNGQVSASLFRNNIDTMTFQNPLTVTVAGPAGLTSGLFTAGRYDLVPDNDFFQARGEYARSFPELYKSRFTAVVTLSSSRQNDRLIEPSLFPLTGRHQRRDGNVARRPLEHDCSAQPTERRRQDRLDARRSRSFGESAERTQRRRQGALLRNQQHHQLLVVQPADRRVGSHPQ